MHDGGGEYGGGGGVVVRWREEVRFGEETTQFEILREKGGCVFGERLGGFGGSGGGVGAGLGCGVVNNLGGLEHVSD